MGLELAHLAYGAGALAGATTVALAVPKAWRGTRRLVAVLDVITGRPPRYDGDQEAKPGLVQRFDQIDDRFDHVDARLECLDGRMTRIEHNTTNGAAEGATPSPGRE